MKIGPIPLENPLVLAPMAGITDLPMRRLAKDAGCALVYSEMVSANGLVYESGRTRELLSRTDVETPLSIQIFGAKPAIMAEAAAMVEAAGADILDINFGCAVKKIIKNGAGVALMNDLALAGNILRAVRRAISIPLTIKIRSGWDASGEDALAVARVAEDCGVDAICLHPRTARQGFGGTADWSLIAALKRSVQIPVIGNGDITTPADAADMLSATGCDAVMIGRAAIGNPWIFAQTLAVLKKEAVPPVSIADRFSAMKRYLADAVTLYGEYRACRMMRSHLGWFAKGLPHASRFRESIKRIESQLEAEELIDAFQQQLTQISDTDLPQKENQP